MIDLSIIIINFNTDDLLEKCLQSIKKHAQGLSFEVIVVNNGTTDPSEVVSEYSFARLVQAENRGFSAANNSGAKLAKGGVLLFLNSDTELLSDNLAEAVAQFKQNAKLGLLTPYLELPDGSPQPGTCGHLPTLWSAVAGKLWPFYNKLEPLEWVTGAAMFIPRKLFEELGGWDERFFMYFEDVDLSFRVREIGYHAARFPDLKILHQEGASISQESAKVRKDYYYASQDYYFRKHHGAFGEWSLRLARFPYRLAHLILGRM
jgi:hypothetical protein